MTDTTRPDGVLRAYAENRISHINRGLCPDGINGFDQRDPDCPVCAALTAPASKPADDEQQELARMKEVLRATPGINGTFDGVGKPAAGGVVEMRDTLGFALENLLEDTQHKEHTDCEEGACPVRDARRVIAEWRAAVAREGGV